MVFSSGSSTVINNSGKIGPSTLPLHVEGRYIKDSNGSTIVLRGVNDGGWVDTPNGGFTANGHVWGQDHWTWNPGSITDELDRLHSLGINCIRSIIVCDWWVNNYQNYRDHYEYLVKQASYRGIYVISGFYEVLGYVSGGETWTDFPYPPYITSSAAKAIVPNEQAFVNICGSLAQKLSLYPNVLYDLWNEVGPHYAPNSPEMQNWWTVVQSCVSTIRQYSEGIVLLEYGWGISCDLNYPNGAESLVWVQNNSVTDPLGNIVYSTHVYRDGGGLGYWGSNNTRASDLANIQRAWNYSLVYAAVQQWNKSLLIGEIGCNALTEASQELIGFTNALSICNNLGVSYTAWIWEPRGSYALVQNTAYPAQLSSSGQALVNAIEQASS